jgi:hypothetical protein
LVGCVVIFVFVFVFIVDGAWRIDLAMTHGTAAA